MKMSKNIVLLSITIVILISLVAIATYSYFTASINVNSKISTNVKMPLRPTFAVSGGGELALTVTRNLTLQENVINGTEIQGVSVISASKNLTVSLTGEPGTTCTYNVYYKDTSSDSTILGDWDFTLFLYKNEKYIFGSDFKQFYQSSAGTPKITAFFGGSTEPFNKAKPVITIPSGSKTATDIWIYSLQFNNLDRDQSALAGKTFKGEFYVGDVTCA